MYRESKNHFSDSTKNYVQQRFFPSQPKLNEFIPGQCFTHRDL